MRQQADKFIGVFKNVFLSIEAKKSYAFIQAWTRRKSTINWVDTFVGTLKVGIKNSVG